MTKTQVTLVFMARIFHMSPQFTEQVSCNSYVKLNSRKKNDDRNLTKYIYDSVFTS